MLVSDEGYNPFYCSVDAATFLHNLRLRFALHRHSHDHHLRHSFASCLLREYGDFKLFEPEAGMHTVAAEQNLSIPYFDAPKLPLIPTYSDRHWIPVSSPSPPVSPLTSSSSDARQKLLDNYSDLRDAILWAKSSDDVNCGSFELSGKADKIKFSVPAPAYSPVEPALGRYNTQETRVDGLVARVQELEVELRGQRIGSETPRSLYLLSKHLDSLLPGIRLLERLSDIPDLDHQKIVNILAEGGHLCGRILDLFRSSEIRFLDLAPSMLDLEGLNLAGRSLLDAFQKPNSFLFVTEISLSDTPLQDFDIVSIHHLPRLSVLWLNNTGIGTEAICHLVSLRRSLTELYIGANPRVNDDVVTPLLMLSKLSRLSLVDTSASLVGLRRFAVFVDRAGQAYPRVHVSPEWINYLSSLEKRYLLEVRPPLIDHPSHCRRLSLAAIKINLSLQVNCDAASLETATKAELTTRLEDFLLTRRADILLREFVLGTGGDMDVDDESEGSF